MACFIPAPHNQEMQNDKGYTFRKRTISSFEVFDTENSDDQDYIPSRHQQYKLNNGEFLTLQPASLQQKDRQENNNLHTQQMYLRLLSNNGIGILRYYTGMVKL